MDRGKWTITALLIIMAVLTVSSVRGEMEESLVSIWVEEAVDLECDYNNSDTDARVWVKNRELLKFVNGIAANNDRISLVNDSTRLRLVNASSDDQGTYICSVSGTPSQTHYFVLQVKETDCDAPAKLSDGEYRSEVSRPYHSSRYNRGERVVYTCNTGYKMIGQAIITCSGTPKQWVPQLPRCQPEFLDPLLKRLESIEAELRAIKSRINTVDNNQTTNDNNTSSVGSIENNQSNNTTSSGSIIHQMLSKLDIKKPFK